MKQLNVNIAERIATFQDVGEKIIGFNGDYEIKFTFDEEWEAYPQKTARFIWNGKHHDVEFTGDTCAVPIIKGASCFSVGVYVGEEAEGDDVLSTTKAMIPLMLSVRCGDSTPQPTTGEHYTNEAKGAAAAAEAAAAEAREAEENVKKAEPKIAYNSMRIEKIEDKLGLDGDMVKIESGYKDGGFFMANMYRYIRILKLGSNGGRAFNYLPEYGAYMPKYGKINGLNKKEIAFGATPDFGLWDCEDERYSNYIFFEGEKAYYHQGVRHDYLDNRYDVAEGEVILLQEHGDGVYSTIIGLAEPIITDITDKMNFDGNVVALRVFSHGPDVNGDPIYLTGAEREPDEVYDLGALEFDGNGYIEFAYMTKEGA